MDEKKLDVQDELLQNLSVDEIAELKVEVDGLMNKIDGILETCDIALNS